MILNRRRGEIFAISVSIVLILAAILQDQYGIFNWFPYDWFLVKVENKDDLFTNLFTVQATIAGLSLAIIAFISGVTDKTVYGISVSEYISRIRPWKLKHVILLIIDLILTIMDYFVVSLRLFNVSVIIFIISIIISILLIIDVFFVFYGDNEIKKVIGNYIIDSYDKNYIDSIGNKITTVIKQKNIDKINDYFDILLRIFKHELDNDNRKDVIDCIGELYTQAFVDSVKIEDNKLSIYILNNITDLYDYSLIKENGIPLKIWDHMNNSYFKLLKNLSYFELEENKHDFITKFRKILYKTQISDDSNSNIKLVNHFDLNTFSYNLYVNILLRHKQKFLSDEINYLSEYIFELSFYDLAYSKNTISEFQLGIVFDEFINMLKLFIDYGNADILENCYFSKIHYHSRNKYVGLSFVIACIYMYYLGYRENIVENTSKQFSGIGLTDVIITRLNKIFRNIKFNEIVKSNRDFILEKLDTWEIIKRNKIKYGIMEDVVYDFIVFSMLSTYNIQFTIDLIKTFNYSEFNALIDRYINNQNEICKLYLDFPRAKNYETKENSSNKFNDFISSLKVYTKQFEQNQIHINSKKLTDRISDKYLHNIKKAFQNTIDDLLNDLPFLQPNIPNDDSDYKIILPITVPVSILTEDFSDLENDYNEIFKQFLLEHIEFLIRDNIVVRKISSVETDNHKLLLSLKKDYGISADIFYGDKALLWDLELSDDKEYFDNLNYVYSNGTLAALLDSEKIQINIYDIEVKYRKLSLKDIVANKIADDIYEYTNSYGVTLEYSEKELINLINASRKKVIISARLEYSIQMDSGVAIEIDL